MNEHLNGKEQVNRDTEKLSFYDSSYNIKAQQTGKTPSPKNSSKMRQFIIRLIARLTETDIMTKGSYLAYHIILSFIPLLIFLSQMLSYIVESFDDLLFNAIKVLPDNAEAIVSPILEGIVSIKSTAVSSLSIISWIWLGSRGFVSLIKTINKTLGLKDSKNFISQRIIAIFYMIGFILLTATLLLFSVFNESILDLITKYIPLDEKMPWLFNLLKNGIGYLMPYIIITIIFTFFYKFAPSTTRKTRIPLDASLLGAVFATLAVKIVTTIYSYMMNNISKLNLYYGSLAGIMALLVWLLMICQIIIIGAEIMASYLEIFKGKKFN